MNERIQKLTELTLNGEMYVNPVKTEYDREDLFLPRIEREVKRLCEFIRNQEPLLTEYSTMTGFFNFDNSVVGDAFRRVGHESTLKKLNDFFYLKPVKNLSTNEAQHATASYHRVLKVGLSGTIKVIEESMTHHSAPEELAFLTGLKEVALALIDWAHKCAERTRTFAETVENPAYRKNLERLSETLLRVPEHAPENFYEAVLTIYLCFSADPDSIGTLDRYLNAFYQADKEKGILTEAEATAYLQELYLMVQAVTPRKSPFFTRGGQSHFCIGGYLPNGEDSFNDFSKLIVTSLMELPIYIPEMTFRWTKKTPREVLRFMMDCERKDPNKRIAFTNDEKRLKAYVDICKIPYERAVAYTMVGCNEPSMSGAITGSNSKINALRCIETLFHRTPEKILNTKTFDEFYAVFEKELLSDLFEGYDYDNKYNLLRGEDINYISSLFFLDCIENAKSLTQGGGDAVVASPMLLGMTNLIDSLIVVRQFVFDEKLLTMEQLVSALQHNWEGFEDARKTILKKGHFFGNDDDLSNEVAQRLYRTFYENLVGKKNVYGYPWLIGDLIGYNDHHKWFGSKTLATPDGRHAGDLIKFGIGQSEGRDHEGLTALLNSIAKLDPYGISAGSTVTNVTLDETLIRDDANFEKTVDLFETYFRNGGTQFQLSYVSTEELLKAKENPQNYGNLRVRVTGFSEYFVTLSDSMQNAIIERSVKK